MNFNRQFILYGSLAVCLLAIGGDWAYRNYYETPLNELIAKKDEIEKKLEKRRHDLTHAKRIAKKVHAWEEQSLPSNVDLARSEYRAWLIQHIERAGIVAPNVDAGSPANHRGQFQSLPFSVRGRATLEQLTRFLYDFYQANRLHQIQSLAITPFPNSNQLDVSLSIDALILPGADRKDRRPAPADVANARDPRPFDNYRTIVRRNLFAAGGTLDPVAQTYLSGITSVNGQFQAWFDLRASNRTVKLSVGDTLDVGTFRGTVVEVDRLDVTLESEGERWIVSVGENLDQAFAVPLVDTASASR